MGVAPTKIISAVILSTLVSSPSIIIVTKKYTNKCMEKFVILKSIGIIAIYKVMQSSTPADIPGDIL